MVDEKKCYFFGRNPTLNDVLVDHQSCSRVHAALIYHKVLERNFLVDLGSSKWLIELILFNNNLLIQLMEHLLDQQE